MIELMKRLIILPQILVNIPSKAERRAILDHYTSSLRLNPDLDLGWLALATPGYTGADLRALAEEAESNAFRRGLTAQQVCL